MKRIPLLFLTAVFTLGSLAPAGAVLATNSIFSAINLLQNAANKDRAQTKQKKKRRKKGLSTWVLIRAHRIGRKINRTGGYRFDGVNDCYGFLRRVWDPVLRFYKKRGVSRIRALPVNDYPSRDWKRIRNWNDLRPGDLLATAKGHFWGASWHAGLYYGKQGGKHKIYDNSGCSSGRCGAYIRTHPRGMFKYYYAPTHKLLVKYGKR